MCILFCSAVSSSSFSFSFLPLPICSVLPFPVLSPSLPSLLYMFHPSSISLYLKSPSSHLPSFSVNHYFTTFFYFSHFYLATFSLFTSHFCLPLFLTFPFPYQILLSLLFTPTLVNPPLPLCIPCISCTSPPLFIFLCVFVRNERAVCLTVAPVGLYVCSGV